MLCLFLYGCKKSIMVKKMLYVCFVKLDKVFVRVPWKLLKLVMRKTGISVVLVRSVMSRYEGNKAKRQSGF